MAQAKTEKQPEDQSGILAQRRRWYAGVGGDANIVGRAAFARAGFADPTLVLRWTQIAGAQTARLARPVKLSDTGVLTLKAEPAAALFLQHESRVLAARINAYLGRVAVTKLRFVQGPLTTPPPLPPKRPAAVEPPAADPARRWHGPPGLGEALLNLARRRHTRSDP
jgi:hypothetical protein